MSISLCFTMSLTKCHTPFTPPPQTHVQDTNKEVKYYLKLVITGQ